MQSNTDYSWQGANGRAPALPAASPPASPAPGQLGAAVYGGRGAPAVTGGKPAGGGIVRPDQGGSRYAK